MRLNRLAAALMTGALIIAAAAPMAAYAYTGEDSTPVTTAETAESTSEQDGEKSDTNTQTVSIGTVTNVNSYLHVRTGAGMGYEIIGHLLNEDQVKVIGSEGDWYKVVVPEHTGYVHGS